MSRLRRLWRGEVPLADAFWNWAVIGGVSFNLLATMLFLALLSADRPVAALVIGHVPVPYNIVAAVGVWRSAARYEGPRQLAGLARVVTLVGMVLLSLA